MARIRTIKPSFWEDELIGAMPATTRLTFIGLFSLADDEGRMRSAPAFVRSQVFMYDDKTTSAEVETSLLQLHNTGRIRLYGNGQRYLEIVNFRKHQYIQRPQASQLPPPGGRHPLLPIEPGHEQAFPIPLTEPSDTAPIRSGREWSGVDEEVSGSLRSPSSVDTVAAPRAPKDPDKTASKVVVDGCWEWYCDLWNRRGARALDFTAERRRQIERAIRKHGKRVVVQVIRYHHGNDWRHAELQRHDVKVLLREKNILAALEAIKDQAARPVSDGVDEIEGMGY